MVQYVHCSIYETTVFLEPKPQESLFCGIHNVQLYCPWHINLWDTFRFLRSLQATTYFSFLMDNHPEIYSSMFLLATHVKHWASVHTGGDDDGMVISSVMYRSSF